MKQRRWSLPLSSFGQTGWMVGLMLLAWPLRMLWLTWQPLWWDEGYSIYFASEPIQRMVSLTADDIHPPLYYLLLHFWLLPGIHPLNARLFSVAVGALTVPLFAWLTHELFPQRPRLLTITTLLLLLNPLQLYYSQEVRMYGLALLLSIASTLSLVRAVKRLLGSQPAWSELLAYGICTTLSLYTLYYLAFLLLAHAIWTVWQLRQHWAALVKFIVTEIVIALAYLPWLLYAGLRLTNYVKHKVASDKDQPIPFAEFWFRHLTAFVTGHLPGNNPFGRIESWLALLAITLWLILVIRLMRSGSSFSTSSSSALLWLVFLFPAVCAFLINQIRPFFPVNGERLLLFVLPYFLLLLAVVIDANYRTLLAKATLALLLTVAVLGITYFYTTPRYREDDYRLLIQQIVQQSTQNDTYLATYPWQVGFWRAYTDNKATDNAQSVLLSDGSVEWNDAVKSKLAQAQSHGVVWFPSLLSIGSTLPDQVNSYFEQQQAVNIADRWVSTTTRLDAWREAGKLAWNDTQIDFGEITVNGFAVTPQEINSVNQSINVAIRWTLADPNRGYNLSLRLQDGEGRTWVQRDVTLGAHWYFDPKGFAQRIGLIVPPGVPPAEYTLVIGFNDEREDRALMLHTTENQVQRFASVAKIIIEPLQKIASTSKLPIQQPLDPAQQIDGVAILGSNIADSQRLAGEQFDLTLFYQGQQDKLHDFNLFVSLLDPSGAGVAGWEGWPVPNARTSSWTKGSLLQAPVTFDIPATVASGNYRLVTGLIDVTLKQKSKLIELGKIVVKQRVAHFEPLQPPYPLTDQPLLGTHALLLGYDLTTQPNEATVTLYWQVKQPILPAHQIFVHFDDTQGTTVAQIDGKPNTADGPAPTGSWQPGEMLITVHRFVGIVPAYDHIQVGLYNPANNQRLPVSVNGAVIGDAVTLR
ncbi:MAG: glycosyltransferase family 39 protein [Caldilineaceae bacterium]